MNSIPPEGYKEYDRLDLLDPLIYKQRLRIVLVLLITIMLISPIGSSLTGYSGWTILIIGLIAILALPVVAVPHELLHALFQWSYAHQKPHIGCKGWYPYSALAKGATISRIEAIKCALAPYAILTIIFITLAILAGGYVRVFIIIEALLQIGMSAGDFILVRWIFKSPSSSILGEEYEEHLVNILFIPIHE